MAVFDPIAVSTSRWQTVALSDAPWIETLKAPIAGLDAIISFVDTIAGIAKTYANLLSKLATDLTDPEKLGIKAAIESIRAMLKDLAGPTGMGVHLINFSALPSLDPALTPGLTIFEKMGGGDLTSLLEKPAGQLGNVVFGVRGTAGGGGLRLSA